MEEDDIDFIPCSLGLVVHCDPRTAQEILRFIHEDIGARIVYKMVSPRGERLWIRRGGDEP